MYARDAKKRHNCTWGGCARSVQCFSALRPGERGTTAAPTSEMEDSLKNLHRSCYRASSLEELVVVKTCLQSTFKAWGAPKRLGNTAKTLVLPPAKTTWSDSNGRYELQMIICTKKHQRREAGTTLIVSSSGCKRHLQKATIGESQTPFITRVSKNAQECTQAMVHNVIQLWYESHALFQATNSIEFGEQSTLMIL